MRLRSCRPHTICHNKNRSYRSYLRRITMMRFKNRTEAGRFLAERLSAYANRSDTLVLGLPRGGVPVAYEVATFLSAPFDVLAPIANSACPATKSWRWALSLRAARAPSIAT